MCRWLYLGIKLYLKIPILWTQKSRCKFTDLRDTNTRTCKMYLGDIQTHTISKFKDRWVIEITEI